MAKTPLGMPLLRRETMYKLCTELAKMQDKLGAERVLSAGINTIAKEDELYARNIIQLSKTYGGQEQKALISMTMCYLALGAEEGQVPKLRQDVYDEFWERNTIRNPITHQGMLETYGRVERTPVTAKIVIAGSFDHLNRDNPILSQFIRQLSGTVQPDYKAQLAADCISNYFLLTDSIVLGTSSRRL